MACLSPSPSGRRLSELLEEKQEPFFLDLHLLEKGCASSRLLDGYDTTAMCWPTAAAAGNDASAVLRRLTSKKTKAATAAGSKHKKQQQQQQQQKPAGGLLQLLLSKVLRGSRAQRKPAALQFSDSFKLAAVAPAPCSASASDSDSDRDRHMELDAVKTVADADADAKAQDANAGRYDSDDDDEKEQLSPVSVLDHPFETSPVHGHGKLLLSPSSKGGAAAMDVFRDLLDAAYSPALLAQLLARSEDLLLGDAVAAADEDDDCYYYRTSPKRCRDDESAAAYWDAHREELARVSELVASELPTSKLSAADVQPERRDVGAEIEAAVFEALLQELVVDLGSGSGCC